jgi:hypothetical protein
MNPSYYVLVGTGALNVSKRVSLKYDHAGR